MAIQTSASATANASVSTAGEESVTDDIRHNGHVPAFIELVEDARVFDNCKSWKKKYQAKRNDVFVPLCAPKEYNGYGMVPVLGGGAIQADLARPHPAVFAASSFVSAACVCSIYQIRSMSMQNNGI